VRRVALAVAIIIAWIPGLAQALGLGEIEIDSYLNQPLKARINLLSRSGEDLFDMKVKMASRKSFERAGIEYQEELRGLRFSVETGANGKSYIRVTTHKRMRAPFLNFLVEVNWSRGRIQREYTLLIDPPTFTKAAAPTPRAPSAARQVVQSRPAVAPARTSRRTPAQESYPTTPYSGDSYITNRNDTLWKIATDVRQAEDISTEQMMLALLNENPNAFIGNNINRLKAGHTLTIPGYDSITSMSQREARAEVGRQYRDWKQGQIGSADAAASSAAGDSGRLELLASDTAGVSSGGQSGEGGDTAAMQKDLSLANEAAEATRQENEELRSRISTLEQQIENVTRIASLKDEQLAAMQKTLADLRAQDTGAAPDEAVTEQPAEAAPDEAVTEQVAEKPDYGPQVEAKPAAPGSPVNQNAVEGYQPVDLDKLPKSELPVQPFKTPAGTPVTEDVAELPEQDVSLTSYTDEMLAYIDDQPIVASIVAAVLGFIVIIVFMSMVRRRRENDDFQESILTDSGELSIPLSDSSVDFEETLPLDETQTQTEEGFTDEISGVSQMSGFDISELDSIDAETAAAEADPLTEADVLMAYGRFQPAEAMIQEAIELEPERKDLKLKLLEIYHAARNQDDFEREASAFQVMVGGQTDPLWGKVKEMGIDLCPESDLFNENTAGSAPVNGLEETLLDMTPMSEPAGKDQKTESAIPTESLDFDLTSFEKEGDGDDDETIVSSDVEDMELDLDLGSGATASDSDETEEKMASDLAAELEDIADSMATGELDLDAVTGNHETSAEFELGGAFEPTVEVHSSDIFDAGVSELDEITTKLDLAKAYIDMGDPDGARSILEEVMEEGNDDQKKDAQGLLDQI